MKVEQWKIDKILPYENNPRINDDAVEKVVMSLEQYGWQQPIVVDSDGIVLAGHTRLKAAKQLGMKQCPVVVAADLTEAQAKAYRIADNKTGEIATWDEELLNLEIQSLVDLDFDIELTGFELDELPDDDLEVIEDDDLDQGGAGDHFYGASSRGFRLGDLMCYITDEQLIERMQVFTDAIIGNDESQQALNGIGEKIAWFIIKNENTFLPKK